MYVAIELHELSGFNDFILDVKDDISIKLLIILISSRHLISNIFM